MIDTLYSNSKNTYSTIAPKLPIKREQIYELILEEYPCSPQQLIQKFPERVKKITRNVASRFTELRDSCHIIEYGNIINDTGHNCTTYRPTNMVERITLINEKFIELRDKKDKFINDRNQGVSDLSLELIQKEINKINNQIKNLK